MSRRIKGIIIGEGNMGKEAVRCMIERGMEVIGGIDIDPELIGKDIGEIAGISAVGAKIEDSLTDLLDRVSPDIAFISTKSEIENLEEYCRICAKHKVNVVTVGEDILYPWPYKPEIAGKLDKVFREHEVTLFGSGIQEVFLSGIGMMAGGACKKIRAVKMKNLLPLNDMGRVVAEEYYVGTTLEEFNRQNEEGNQDQAVVMGRALPLYAACESWGLCPTQIKISNVPIVTDVEILYPQWGMTVPAGNLIGFTLAITLETKEGITWNRESSYKYIDPEKESVATHWYIEGEPKLHVTIDDICGEITTSSTVVNRIPDILNAKPGLVTFIDLGTLPKYHPYAFEIEE